MNQSDLFLKQIKEILIALVNSIDRIEPASRDYSSLLTQSFDATFFSSPDKDKKKDISSAYFQFGSRIKDIVSDADQDINQLMEIMLEADRQYLEKIIDICDQALKGYVMLQNEIATFCRHTEQHIAFRSSLSFNDLSNEVRRLLLQVQCARDRINTILLKLT